MPTGQTPTPQYKRGKGADSLSYGEAVSANDMLAQMAPPMEDGSELYQPSGPEEEFLFGPTDRPNEPITAGAPFGPGPLAPKGSFRTERAQVATVAELVRTNPQVSAEARAWAARVQAGE